MTYQDTVNWMFNQLPMYQNKGKSAYKSDLSNTINLASHLDHPEKKFKSVHIAGTNGKGSTSHMIASVLQEAGLKVGLYTSPHLKDFRERIKLNGQCISKHYVINFIKRNQSFFEENKLSFFEMTVGLAFDYFAKKRVDIAIIEVGLGGRLDSTNIILPELSVITNIGLDHTEFLGNTVEAIAMEKAGIIKPKIPVVIGETQNKILSIFKKRAKELDAKIVFADQLEGQISYETDLKGNYQTQNVRTAVAAINQLQDQGFEIRTTHIKKGLLHVVGNTGLQGRWQILNKSPKIICDTAHNKEGLSFVMQQLKTESYEDLHIVIGFVNDKDLDRIIDLFPKKAQYYFCKPNIERGLIASILKSKFESYKLFGMQYKSVDEALKAAKKNAKKTDLIFVGGSTFVVAEIL